MSCDEAAPRVVMAGRASRHMEPATDRSLTDSLLAYSNDHADVDLNLGPVDRPHVTRGGAFDVGGWDSQPVSPIAKVPPPRESQRGEHKNKKNKGDVRGEATGSSHHAYHCADDSNLQVSASIAEWPTGKSGRRRSFASPEVDDMPWKQCVEPMTCRYIPNNGRYRAFKCSVRLDLNSHKLNRRPQEKMTPEQRHLQRKIKRELREEMDRKHKSGEPADRPKDQDPVSHGVEDEGRDLAGGSASIPTRQDAGADCDMAAAPTPRTDTTLQHKVKKKGKLQSNTLSVAHKRQVSSGPDMVTVHQGKARDDSSPSVGARSKSEPPLVVHNVDHTKYSYLGVFSANKLGNRESSHQNEDVRQRTVYENFEVIASTDSTAATKSSTSKGAIRGSALKVSPQARTVQLREEDLLVSSRATTDHVTSSSGPQPSAAVSVMHIKYTTASGETIDVPKMGTSPLTRDSSFYGVIERENDSGPPGLSAAGPAGPGPPGLSAAGPAGPGPPGLSAAGPAGPAANTHSEVAQITSTKESLQQVMKTSKVGGGKSASLKIRQEDTVLQAQHDRDRNREGLCLQTNNSVERHPGHVASSSVLKVKHRSKRAAPVMQSAAVTALPTLAGTKLTVTTGVNKLL